MTYELISGDVPAETAARWRERMTDLVDYTLENSCLRSTSPPCYPFYADDAGTGTNHYADYVANLYTAGRVMARPGWSALGQLLMLRLAQHEQAGQFPERYDVPATHYTWLTMNALGEYFEQSGDQVVRPILERCVEWSVEASPASRPRSSPHPRRAKQHLRPVLVRRLRPLAHAPRPDARAPACPDSHRLRDAPLAVEPRVLVPRGGERALHARRACR